MKTSETLPNIENAPILPADVLIATLSRISPGIRLESGERLVRLFNRAAQNHPELYGAFAMNPIYEDSKLLRSLLVSLDIGAAIIRENATINYFRVAKQLHGAFGKESFDKLTTAQQKVVQSVADDIIRLFRR